LAGFGLFWTWQPNPLKKQLDIFLNFSREIKLADHRLRTTVANQFSFFSSLKIPSFCLLFRPGIKEESDWIN
jgi:hypothetical protein